MRYLAKINIWSSVEIRGEATKITTNNLTEHPSFMMEKKMRIYETNMIYSI